MSPSIDVIGITISEPTTAATDYLIMVFAWWFGGRLFHLQGDSANSAIRFWGLAFIFIGLGAVFGGTSHGLATYLGERADFYIWKTTVYAVGLSMLFAVAGTIVATPLGNAMRKTLHILNVTAFAIYATWMLGHSAFVYVIYHYVPAMITIALLQVLVYVRQRSSGPLWLIAGVVITLCGAIIQQSGLTIHEYFNNNDLYHLIQIVGLILLYRGARALGEVRLPG